MLGLQHPLLDGHDIDHTSDSARLKGSDGVYFLYVNGEIVMTLHSKTANEFFQLYSSYDLAHGDCILSGLGLGLLISMLKTKPNVTSITVYEKHQDVINLNRELNLIDDSITIVNDDIHNLIGSNCDCLLLDHFHSRSGDETDLDSYHNDNKFIFGNNNAKTVWYCTIEDKFALNTSDLLSSYNTWKANSNIESLPILSEEKLLRYTRYLRAYK